MKGRLFLLFMCISQLGMAQDICLSCILGEKYDTPGLQDYLYKTYGKASQTNSKLEFSYNDRFEKIQSSKTSIYNVYGSFQSLFDYLGIKKTYKETKKSAKEFIVDKGKDAYKDRWLDMYDPVHDVGVKITWDKDNDYLYTQFEVYSKSKKSTKRPWCNYSVFECVEERSVLAKIDNVDLWKLVGFNLTECDTLSIVQNTMRMKKEGYMKMDGSQMFVLTYTPFLTIKSVLIDLNTAPMEFPKGITKSSSLADLKAVYGVPYDFDGTHFEVLFGDFSDNSGAWKSIGTFILNENQDGISHFSLEFNSGMRRKTEDLSFYTLSPAKGLNEKCKDGSYRNYYYCNGYSFYGVMRNNIPYDGKISNVFNKKVERYSIPDQIEAERLAKLTKEEIEQEERDKLAREEAIKKEERAVENGKKLKQYVANQEGIIKRIGLDYNKFIKSYVNACQSDDLPTRGYYNKEAYNYLKQMQETINELQSEMGRFKTFMSTFPISEVINGKYQELYSLSTDMLYFTYDLHRTAWTEGNGLKYGAITNTIDTVEEYLESKNNKIEDYINQARLIPNEMLVLLYEANNK